MLPIKLLFISCLHSFPPIEYYHTLKYQNYGHGLLNNPAAKTTILIVASFFILSTQLKTQTFTQPGFNQVLVANGISNPIVMEFAPDGRLFVAQQNGVLRIIENGVLLETPAITLSVDSSGERGLLGIAFDPDFSNNHFIYLYYTLASAANNRISRFTLNGNTIALSSELVVLNLDQKEALLFKIIQEPINLNFTI